jgi:hypothetical protein
MPLTDTERSNIRQEVFNVLDGFPRGEVFTSVYGSERIGVLAVHSHFLSKPLAFQRQLLIMLAERQVFTQTVGDQTVTFFERCRDTGGNPNVWGTDVLSGEAFLEELRNNTINQKPELYRCVFLGLFRTTYAKNWAHWLSISGSGRVNPQQGEIGLFNYEKNQRWHMSDYWWWQLHEFVVGTRSGDTINYGLLPQLWVDAIEALEPVGTAEEMLQTKTPPPVYIFSLDTLPDLDKNTFVMIDLLGETPPATLQDLLALKVKQRGKQTVFNALYAEAEKRKEERKRVLVNPTVETYAWDNTAYIWSSSGEATVGREIVYETKNYLTLSQALTILNNL